MLDVRDLRLIAAIAQAGSLARAAREMGMGQPNITRALAAIEAKLKTPLFERDRRGMLPTDMCRAVLAEAEGIIERLADLNARLGVLRGNKVQDIVVAAGPYVGESLGAVAAARLLGIYPAVRLRILMTNWAELPRLIREREAGLGIVNLDDLGDVPDLAVERLLPQPAIFIVRPAHPLTLVARPSLADILAFPVIVPGRLPRRYQAPLVAAREAAIATGQAHQAFPAMLAENPAFGLAVVAGSDAVMPVPHMLAATAIAAGTAVALPMHEAWMRLQWGIIRLRGRQLSEAEEAFLDLIRNADRQAVAAGEAFFAALSVELASA